MKSIKAEQVNTLATKLEISGSISGSSRSLVSDGSLDGKGAKDKMVILGERKKAKNALANLELPPIEENGDETARKSDGEDIMATRRNVNDMTEIDRTADKGRGINDSMDLEGKLQENSMTQLIPSTVYNTADKRTVNDIDGVDLPEIKPSESVPKFDS